MLYVPGCAPRYLNKARSLKVDSVIFDLGDSVLVENKEASRKQICEAILIKRRKIGAIYEYLSGSRNVQSS